jgi:hypothetical protein
MSEEWETTYLVRVYECGCVGAVGDVPEGASILGFPKCPEWEEWYAGDDFEAADAWAEKHFEETPHTMQYRRAAP